MVELAGVFSIMPAVFDDDGRLDEIGMRRVFDFIVEAGAAGVVFPGLASEYEHLSPDERLEYTAKLGAWAEDRCAFIVGASAPSLEQAELYAEAGARAGARAAMVLTPHALAQDAAAMASFYRVLGERGGIPIMLQNAPPPMGIGLTTGRVAALVDEVEAIRFVKEEAMPSGHRITALANSGISLDAVFGGAGGRYVIDELNRGARGTMPACEITEVHVAMLAAFTAGDERRARDLFERSLPLLSMQAIFRWRLTKEVLRRRGLIASTFTRAPGPELDRHDHRELDQLLARLAETTSMPAMQTAGLAA